MHRGHMIEFTWIPIWIWHLISLGGSSSGNILSARLSNWHSRPLGTPENMLELFSDPESPVPLAEKLPQPSCQPKSQQLLISPSISNSVYRNQRGFGVRKRSRARRVETTGSALPSRLPCLTPRSNPI